MNTRMNKVCTYLATGVSVGGLFVLGAIELFLHTGIWILGPESWMPYFGVYRF